MIEWYVSAVKKDDPRYAQGFIRPERKPTDKEIAEWREWHHIGDEWEVTVYSKEVES